MLKPVFCGCFIPVSSPSEAFSHHGSSALSFENPEIPAKSVSPFLELGACELLVPKRASFKSIAERFREAPGALPSDLVDRGDALKMAEKVLTILSRKGLKKIGGTYPSRR